MPYSLVSMRLSYRQQRKCESIVPGVLSERTMQLPRTPFPAHHWHLFDRETNRPVEIASMKPGWFPTQFSSGGGLFRRIGAEPPGGRYVVPYMAGMAFGNDQAVAPAAERSRLRGVLRDSTNSVSRWALTAGRWAACPM